MSDHTPRSENSRRRHVRRLRVACARCRQRKIRCDAAIPSCGACMKNGARCVYEDDLPPTRRQQIHESTIHVAGRREHAEQPDISNPRENTQANEAESHLSSVFSPIGITADSVANGSRDNLGRESTSPVTATCTTQSRLAQQETPSQAAGSRSFAPPLPPPSHSHSHHEDIPSHNGNLSHQVGLVSLSAGVDPKYVGPSSGYFFTQLLSSTSKDRSSKHMDDRTQTQVARQQKARDLAVQAFKDIPIGLPATESVAQQISTSYFDSIHLQYPFLHQQSHEKLIRQVFEAPARDEIATFQVTMVLSISALVLSRRSHVELPAAGWCAAAMRNFSSLQIESSLRGLQCLLLLIIYAMHSPSSNFNAWSMNYQCIAMVLDLGLQREPSNAVSLSLLQREMRTRIFWVVYSVDRKLSTMMGRPIGLRDEACDLRLPMRISDELLDQASTLSDFPGRTTHIDYAIHLFKIAKINSEMKYILHSVNRETPSYAYPAVRDMMDWQDTKKNELDEWHATIPQPGFADSNYGELVCKTQYHTIKMLLFLPSPGIPQPSPEALRICYTSSVAAIKLFRDLYAREVLVYNWSTCHAIILHAFCLIYCVTIVPQLRQEATMESLFAIIRDASDVLSATGEYWTGARRTRDLLNELASKVFLREPVERSADHGAPVAGHATNDGVNDSASFPFDSNATFTSTTAEQAQQRSEENMDGGDLYQQWGQLDAPPLSFLFEGVQFGEDSYGHQFDIGDLFTDAINFPGNMGETSDMRFTF